MYIKESNRVRPLQSTRGQPHFSNATGDMEPSDMQQVKQDSDMDMNIGTPYLDHKSSVGKTLQLGCRIKMEVSDFRLI